MARREEPGEKGEEGRGARRGDALNPTPFSLGHFTLSQFLLGPFTGYSSLYWPSHVDSWANPRGCG